VQGVFFDHENSLVRLARWNGTVGSKTRSAIMRKPARAGARANPVKNISQENMERKHGKKTAQEKQQDT
jgi:hypothetical protein